MLTRGKEKDAPRVLIACDKFKGSLTAPEACQAIADGVRISLPGASIDVCPIADGGEGFTSAMVAALQGSLVSCDTVDAVGRSVSATYGIANSAGGKLAILEMAEAAGLWRIAAAERNPAGADTRGVGQMIRHAVENHQPDRVLVGIGGSATNDGGAGMAHALGVRFLDDQGCPVPPRPDRLADVTSIDTSARLPLPEIVAACDVTNPLLGPNGATAVFGAQKGVTSETAPAIESALAHLVERSGGATNAAQPGAGAAGGLGFGLLHFCGATLAPGFEMVATATDLPARIRAADIVVTGEGSLDHQSLQGKGPAEIARLARQASRPVVAFVGRADAAVRQSGLFDHISGLDESGETIEDCIRRAADLLFQAVSTAPWRNFLKDHGSSGCAAAGRC